MPCYDYFDDNDVNWQERYGLLRLMMLLIMMTTVMMITIMMMTMMTKMKMTEKQVIICLRIASDFIHNQFSVFKVLPAFGASRSKRALSLFWSFRLFVDERNRERQDWRYSFHNHTKIILLNTHEFGQDGYGLACSRRSERSPLTAALYYLNAWNRLGMSRWIG